MRLILLELRTNSTYECALETELVRKLGTYSLAFDKKEQLKLLHFCILRLH